ncbi:sodium:solute symporter [Nocardioides gansuensis]|uniref:Sodium:solute symporter n=1 Tax=Nocardioides gansuensis TaxID=2138300 RepID=A0A2T8F6H5_9ACTN|nr:sodium:solute symporter [Nocardioides gansuensis]
MDPAALAAFVAVLAGTSLVALGARRFHRAPPTPTPADWALGGRRFGSVTTWFLLGGTIYTAYTFSAVPALVYSTGALGFFALPYTIIVWPLAFWLLPRLWREAREVGAVTVADLVRVRYDAPGLALAVALTGILSTMPYVALQLLGIRTVLVALDAYPEGLAGDAILAAVFAVLALATYRNGIRAPAVIAFVKGVLVFCAITLVTALVLHRLGGAGNLFLELEQRLSSPADTSTGAAPSLALHPSLYLAYGSLALGSALALLMYPHVLTAAFAARSERVLRVNSVALLAWTGLLGLVALLGLAAHAADIAVDPGRPDLAVPALVEWLTPGWVTGLILGSLAIGALVPAAVMSVAAAMLFTRNIYAEYVNPQTTPEQQTGVARFVSLLVKVGALGFVMFMAEQDAINLQLLGGVWILQIFPAVVLGLLTGRLHPAGLFAGWAVGMLAGTFLVTTGGFSSVVSVAGLPLYAALVALGANLLVVVLLSAFLPRATPWSRAVRLRRLR